MLSPSKCRFFVNRRVFGFLISEQGIQADPDKVAAVGNRLIPTTIKAGRALIAAELIEMHAAPPARINGASLKSARDQTRAYTQEDKALVRVYGTGDWVLRERSRRHKHESFYDGPWLTRGYHHGNAYSLSSSGGIALMSRYNGSRLFPTYVRDGRPVRSLWYASERL